MVPDRFSQNWKLVSECNGKSFTAELILAVNPCLLPLILRILATAVSIYKAQKYPRTVDVDQPISDIVKVLSWGISVQAELEILFGSSVLDGDMSLADLDRDEPTFVVSVISYCRGTAEEWIRVFSGFNNIQTISPPHL
jgi:hypothetical protein